MEIYLDNAATSHPKPECVVEAVTEALTLGNANPGRSSHTRAIRAMRMMVSAREAVAGAVGAEAEDVCFALNGTDALNEAVKGALAHGGHVVATTLEHNSVLRPIVRMLQRGQAELTLVKPGEDGTVDPEDIRRAVRADTALVVCTHASNVTGAIQPVEAIGGITREMGIPYLVDGAQALGAVPVDVKKIGCQMYAFPGHKGLLGPQGTGGLYIQHGWDIEPIRQGGTGTSSHRLTQPEERPERYESGTQNLPGLWGLNAGARYAMARLTETMRIEAELTEMLLMGLHELGAEVYAPAARRVGTVSFNMPGLTSAQVTDRLDGAGICVRGGLHCAPLCHRDLGTYERGAVRVSVGPQNRREDIEALLSALREMG